jgi:glutamine synthetase
MVEKGETAAIEKMLRRAEESHVEFVHLQFTDVVGIVKSVTIPVDQLANVCRNGRWFDGSSVEGFARIAESDMFLSPDPATFAVVPWESDPFVTARVICRVFTPNGEPFMGSPREVLMRVMGQAREMGFVFETGPELEFFLFRNGEDGQAKPIPQDRGGYFDLSTDRAVAVRKHMVKTLNAFGIRVEASHHEVAYGQHEIDFEYANAVQSADNAVTFKYALKAIAQLNNLHATFMPKPIFGINGSGMHVHQSMSSVETGENLFYDANDVYHLSEIAKQYIAGQMVHARGMCAVLAPLVNSYKRLVPGYEAPVYISWARTNRSALIRVPEFRPGNEHSTRMELRCPDPSCDPYLAFSVMLAAGLDGIRRKLVPPDPIEESLYDLGEADRRRRQLRVLPGSLGEALQELEADDLVREALGDHVYERFVHAKTQEWDEYRTQVTPWEIDRYLPVF